MADRMFAQPSDHAIVDEIASRLLAAIDDLAKTPTTPSGAKSIGVLRKEALAWIGAATMVRERDRR